MHPSARRNGLWGPLGISLALHGAALAALALGGDARPHGAHAEGAGAGGTGVVFVELLRDPGDDAPTPPGPTRTEPVGPPEPAPLASHPSSRPQAPALEVAARSPAKPLPPEPGAAGPAPTRETARRVANAGTDPAGAGTAPGGTRAPALGPRASGDDGERSPDASREGTAEQASGSGPLSRVARPARKIRPRYPAAARERGDEGFVVVEAQVAENGRVEHARVRSSGGHEFDTAALEAVRAARFLPAWRGGAPVASTVAMRLHFELER